MGFILSSMLCLYVVPGSRRRYCSCGPRLQEVLSVWLQEVLSVWLQEALVWPSALSLSLSTLALDCLLLPS